MSAGLEAHRAHIATVDPCAARDELSRVGDVLNTLVTLTKHDPGKLAAGVDLLATQVRCWLKGAAAPVTVPGTVTTWPPSEDALAAEAGFMPGDFL